jgi:transcriptional/translational regulatory protein YebC/TACO1
MFGQWGMATVEKVRLAEKNISIEDFELAVAESGAEDVKIEEEIEVKSKIDNFQKVLAKIKEIGVEPKDSGLRWESKEKMPVDAEVEAKLRELFEELEENDDVEDYFTNAE